MSLLVFHFWKRTNWTLRFPSWCYATVEQFIKVLCSGTRSQVSLNCICSDRFVFSFLRQRRIPADGAEQHTEAARDITCRGHWTSPWLLCLLHVQGCVRIGWVWVIFFIYCCFSYGTCTCILYIVSCHKYNVLCLWNLENVGECCKAQGVWVHQRIALYKSYLLLLLPGILSC